MGTPAAQHRAALAGLSPEELALRAQGGSVEAYSALVRVFEGRVFNFLLRRVHASEAEDLAQETFIRAWQRIGQYDRRWRFSTWLFTIATRLANSRGRSMRLVTGLEEGHGAGEEGSWAGSGMARRELRDRVWLLVDRALSQEQATGVWLRYVEGMSMQEIAQVLGKSQVGVRVMLHRARGVLAERIEAEGLSGELGIGGPDRERVACAGGAR